MRFSRLISCSVMVGLTIFVSPAHLGAQAETDRMAAAKARLEQATTVLRALPAPARKGISGSAENLLHIAEGFEKVEDRGLPKRLQQAAALATPQPAAPRQ